MVAESINVESWITETDIHVRHALLPGSTWRAGRGRQCELALPHLSDLSQVSVLLRYPVGQDKSGSAQLALIAMQRGSAGIEVINDAQDSHLLRRGSRPLLLRPRSNYQIRVLTPRLRMTATFTTPEDIPAQPDMDPSGTQTWTVSRRGDRHHPIWLDVVALACLIEDDADYRPTDSGGETASASVTLRLGCEVFVGSSSNDFVQRQLRYAADDAGLSVAKFEDKQARVARYYLPLFAPEKLRQLSAITAEAVADLWAAQREFAP